MTHPQFAATGLTGESLAGLNDASTTRPASTIHTRFAILNFIPVTLGLPYIASISQPAVFGM